MNTSHFVVVAGDTLDQRIDVPDFPSSAGWTLKYRLFARFTSPAQAAIPLTAVGNADGSYQLQAGPSDTGAWAAGAYGWGRWVEKVGARQTLSSSNEQGEVLVRANPATATQGTDTRSHPRKVLEAIEACLEARATTTQREMVEYTIASRGQKFDPTDNRAALVQLRSTYVWLVANEDARERIAAGQPNPRNVGIRFWRPR